MGLGKNKHAVRMGTILKKRAMTKEPRLYVEIGERMLSDLGYWAIENGLVLKEETIDVAVLVKGVVECPIVGQVAELSVKNFKTTSWLEVSHGSVKAARVLVKGEEVVGIALWWNEDAILVHPCIPSRNLNDVYIPSPIFPKTCFAMNIS